MELPFLVLLVSGGHSLLVLAHSIDRWSIIGQSIDDAPGEALDKACRICYSLFPSNIKQFISNALSFLVFPPQRSLLDSQKLCSQGARRLKLRNIPECATMSGGRAIEHLAVKGDPHAFEFPTPMWKYRDCTFSFSGLKNALKRNIENLEKQYGKCSQSIYVIK